MDTNCYEASPLASQDLPRNNSGAYSARLSKVEKISSVDGFDGVGEVVVMMVHSPASVSPSGAAMPPWRGDPRTAMVVGVRGGQAWLSHWIGSANWHFPLEYLCNSIRKKKFEKKTSTLRLRNEEMVPDVRRNLQRHGKKSNSTA